MKITDEMVDAACEAYSNRGAAGITPVAHGAWMRDALEGALGSYNRWAAFSDEEVRELYAAEADRSDSMALPEELRECAHRLARELLIEDRRRVGGYQGPAVYRTYTGKEYEVLGRVGNGGPIVMRDTGANGVAGFLHAETWETFHQTREDGGAAWSYVHPLGE